MSEFNTENWKAALTSVFERAIRDPAYRALCLTDARAAVTAVSEIELPTDFNFEFLNNRSDITYWYLLPPASATPRATEDSEVNDLVRWSLCTDPTG